MRKPLFILALAGGTLFWGGLKAQDTVSPWKVEGLDPNNSTIKYDLKSGEMRATNGVRVKYKASTPEAAELTAKNATVNQKKGSVVASGNVILRRGGTIWKSERIEYNFRSKQIKSAQFRSGTLAVFIQGENMFGSRTNGVYQARNVTFSSDDTKSPDFYIKAKEVEITPGKHAIFRGATVYAGKIPVFYLPYYKRSLKDRPWDIRLTPGYKSEWGAYLLGSLRFPDSEKYMGEFNLDYRTERGFGFGPTIQYNSPKWGQGDLRLYRASDDDPLTDSRGIAIDRERDLAQWSHRLKHGSLTATSVLNYESDEYMRRDFFEDQYRQNVQPNSYFELSKNWSNYNLSVLAQPRVNAFYEGIQRTPDIKLSGTRHQLGNSPFYYDTETSAGYFERRYNYSSANNDYGLFRADTLHQIYLPKTYRGWLNVTPRIGARLTHYGESNGAGTSKISSERYIAHAGVEVSTKFSKMMPEIDNKILGISNGARHIMQPSLNYAFIPKPNRVPDELDKFDYEITSPRLLPINLPEYNAIDNIDSQNVLRMSLRNRLQTKRNTTLVDVIDWDVYTDWRLDTVNNQNTFADAFSDAYLRPRDWLTLNSNLRYDIDNSLWRTYSHGFSIHPKSHEWSINGGQYHYLAQPSTSSADRTDVYYSGLGLRLNENWSFSTRQYYDSKAGQMSRHDYILHRDMSNWTFFIDLSFRKDTGRRRDDTSISFNYSLKAFPRKPALD